MTSLVRTAELFSCEIESVGPAQFLVPADHPDLAPQDDSEDAFKRRSLFQPAQQPWLTASDTWKQTFEPGDMPELLQALQNGRDIDLLFVAQATRKMLSRESDPPIQEVIDAQLLQPLMAWMQRSDFTQLQFESTWAFTNIASGSQISGTKLIEKGCMPLLITLLESPNQDVKEQAVWAIGNLAGDSSLSRDLVLQSGALPSLLAYAQRTERASALRNTCWAISNLCRGRPRPPSELIACTAPILAEVLKSLQDLEAITDCCWAFSYLSDGSREMIQGIIETGVGTKLVEFLAGQVNVVQLPVLRTFGNLTSSTNEHTQYVLDVGALGGIVACLGSVKKAVRKEAAWTLSNIAAGTSSQLAAVVECGALGTLIEMLHSESPEVRKECIWTISNALDSKDPTVVDYLMERRVLERLCELLQGESDPKVVSITLDSLANILQRYKQDGAHDAVTKKMEEFGVLSKLEELQLHSDQSIFQKAASILEMNFKVEE